MALPECAWLDGCVYKSHNVLSRTNGGNVEIYGPHTRSGTRKLIAQMVTLREIGKKFMAIIAHLWAHVHVIGASCYEFNFQGQCRTELILSICSYSHLLQRSTSFSSMLEHTAPFTAPSGHQLEGQRGISLATQSLHSNVTTMNVGYTTIHFRRHRSNMGTRFYSC